MILLLDTSTPDCHVAFFDTEGHALLEDVWHADRELAENMLGYLEEKMAAIQKDWHGITGIGLFKGPGSFTGLRIGTAVCNTIASDQHIPIVGVQGDDWQQTALDRLKAGENDEIVLPDYGRPARITTQRK